MELFRLPSVKVSLNILDKWVKSAGIQKHVTWHVGRVSFATMLLTHGVDIYTCSKLLGHKSITMIEPYVNLVDQKKVDAVKMLPIL